MEISTSNDSTGPMDQDQTSDGIHQTPSEFSDQHNSSPSDNTDVEDDAVSDVSPDDDMASLMEMYEESFKRFAEGEVVSGKIISVDKDHVLVDIGYKSEGQIRIHEFKDENGEIKAEVGDVVEVMVEWWDDENEVVVLSKEKAAKVKVWDEIKKSYENEESVRVLLQSCKGRILC